jgi:hypothetical protein
MTKTYLTRRQQATFAVLCIQLEKDVTKMAAMGDADRMMACLDSYEALLKTALNLPCVGDEISDEAYANVDLNKVGCHKE